MASENALILLAAGSGKRMGRKIPKIFLPLAGRPLIYWSLRFLETCPTVHSIVAAVPPGLSETFRKKVSSWRFKKVSAVVEGGRERTDSTSNAVQALPAQAKWVGIHDAARPFVTPGLIHAVFNGAKKTGCAILAVPAKDTIKISRRSPPVIEKTVPRSQCWQAQTPQVFRRDIAEKIHVRRRAGSFTDDASIAESLGYQVALVPGSYENMKITTPEDLLTAERLLKKMVRKL